MRIDTRAEDWIAAGIGLVSVLTWALVGIQALTMDHEPSAKPLLACLAFAIVGLSLGPALWVVTTPIRRRQSADVAAMVASQPASSAMLGLMVVGLSLQPALNSQLGVWDWVYLSGAAFVGGLNLGVALQLATRSTTPSHEPGATSYPRPHTTR